MIAQGIAAFFATVAFSILFHVPKKEYGFCGLTGTIGWLCYAFFKVRFGNVMAVFIATLVLTCLARGLAVCRKVPITIFLIAGIFPLVPGSGIYYTAYYFIMNDNVSAVATGLETIKIGVAIALGIVMIFTLPYHFFNRTQPKHLKD